MDDRAPEQPLAEAEERKNEEVLEREGLEQELMQEGSSEAGARITGVEENQ